MIGLPTMPEQPWLHIAFASLHLLCGQGFAAWLFKRRFGTSPLVLYRPGPPTRHQRLTRATGALSLCWAVAFLLYALSAGFRNSLLGISLFAPPMLLGWVAGVLGLLLMLAAQVDMGPAFRVGQDEQEALPKLVTTGIHGRSRHPVYVGSFAYLSAMTLWSPCLLSLLSLAAIGGLLHALVLAEEAHLLRVFGDAYRNYAAQTRRYL